MKVTGLIGIEAVNANWNADWDKKPRTLKDGTVFGSAEALKYAIKSTWEEQNKTVFGRKSFKTSDNGNQTPRTLEERYCSLFMGDETTIGKDVTTTECVKNLFTCIDVKNFGSTFAIANLNTSITGVAQFGDGLNRYEDTGIEVKKILSPFRNPTNKITKDDDGEYTESEKKNTTAGEQFFTDEAHYVYPFSINSNKLRSWVNDGLTDDYNDDDFQELKQAMLVCATAVTSSAKMGCRNEFGIFIKTTDNTYLQPFDDSIMIEHDFGKKEITLNINAILEPIKDQILNIEIHYNPLNTDFITDITLDVNYFNIVTGSRIS